MENNESPEILAPSAPPPTPARLVDEGTHPFIGRFGLRAVWGILLFIVLIVGFSFVLNVGTRLAQGQTAFPKHGQTAHGQPDSPKPPGGDVKFRQTLISDAVGFVAVVAV